jgi:Ni,Fe-hydrogenase I cytochrome b subunit
MIWVRLVILAAAIAPVGYLTHDLIDVAICRAVGEALFLPGLFHAVHRIAGISARQYAETIYRPLLAATIMAIVVMTANMIWPLAGNYRLVADIGLGAAVFLASAWLLWTGAGRPHTPEANVFSYLANRMRPASRLAGG